MIVAGCGSSLVIQRRSPDEASTAIRLPLRSATNTMPWPMTGLERDTAVGDAVVVLDGARPHHQAGLGIELPQLAAPVRKVDGPAVVLVAVLVELVFPGIADRGRRRHVTRGGEGHFFGRRRATFFGPIRDSDGWLRVLVMS